MNFLGDLLISGCALFGSPPQDAGSSGVGIAQKLQLIDAQWPQPRADKSAICADEVRLDTIPALTPFK